MKVYGIRAYSTIVFPNETHYKNEILAGGDNESTKQVFAEMQAEIGEWKDGIYTRRRTDKVELLEFNNWYELQKALKDKVLNQTIKI